MKIKIISLSLIVITIVTLSIIKFTGVPRLDTRTSCACIHSEFIDIKRDMIEAAEIINKNDVVKISEEQLNEIITLFNYSTLIKTKNIKQVDTQNYLVIKITLDQEKVKGDIIIMKHNVKNHNDNIVDDGIYVSYEGKDFYAYAKEFYDFIDSLD